MLGSSLSSTRFPPEDHSRSSQGSNPLCSHSACCVFVCECVCVCRKVTLGVCSDAKTNFSHLWPTCSSNASNSRERYWKQQAIRKYCVFECVYQVAWDLHVLGSFLNIGPCFYFYSSASHRGECTECLHIRHPGGLVFIWKTLQAWVLSMKRAHQMKMNLNPRQFYLLNPFVLWGELGD